MQETGVRERLTGVFFKALGVPLSILPLWAEAIGAGVFISMVVDRNPGLRERFMEIEGKVFRFEAGDIKRSFHLVIEEGGIRVVPHVAGPPDVTMRGELRVLAEVLLGRVDPDTVFFSRRLEITGDTAAAIHFKNILASIG
jgi:predicted lipid carrier protein YhbT